ncbi:MAG TPA: alpha/beta fold hydrolase [Kribbella sp.]|nr:alpha/beta fold hydrolase [Kribbella sp.]
MSTLERSPSSPRAPSRPQHPLIVAAIALVLGTGLTAAGAGIGIRHLEKAGLTVLTVVGLMAMVAGLVLLGFGFRLSWKALDGWARLALVPVGLAVLVVCYALAIAVMVTVVPPTSLGAETPADRGMTYRDVSFTTTDGVQLSAWYVPSGNGAAVVLMHGAGSTRTAVLPHAAVLARHGYGVLMVDARGHGKSGGRGMDLGWYGDQDVMAAVTFLTQQPGVDPGGIGVVGLSMGGEQAVGAAAADDRIRAVVGEGVTARTAADRAGWLPGGLEGALLRGLDALTYGFVDLLTPASPPARLDDAVAAADNARFLLITGGTVPEEPLAAAHLKAAAPDRVDVWEVGHAGHTEGLQVQPAEWDARVVALLDAQLSPSIR